MAGEYVFPNDWYSKMIWLVDIDKGPKAAFTTTFDAARYIVGTASYRDRITVTHIPTGVSPFLPAKGEKDREAVMDALAFIVPPVEVQDL